MYMYICMYGIFLCIFPSVQADKKTTKRLRQMISLPKSIDKKLPVGKIPSDSPAKRSRTIHPDRQKKLEEIKTSAVLRDKKEQLKAILTKKFTTKHGRLQELVM
jgi:hypothetical protein